MTENQQRIIQALSDEIAHQMITCAAEQCHPSHDADRSDDLIKTSKENALKLRSIRDSLEEMFTGVILF